jgi:ribosomal protein S18 acetylase RimI-like enzyme
MASIPLPARAAAHPHLRPLNPLRDLPQVADLIELCFSRTMDREGEQTVREMRRAGRDEAWLRWASRAIEGSSTPLNGYIWEVDGRVVGNASLIAFRHRGLRITLLANVAVHPDYRHRGIARTLTERVLQHARERHVDELWLHARDDNPDALDLYTDLGFVERARRTSWLSTTDPAPVPAAEGFTIAPRPADAWPRQREWLAIQHPEELAWYRAWNFRSLAPGLWNWFHLLFVDINLRQWAAFRDGNLQAVLSWTPSGTSHDPLWLALGPESAPEAAAPLLVRARSEVGRRKFVLEHPAGLADESIRAAGFRAERTLVWMRAGDATT